jgi:hypothetical protein
MLCKTEMIDTMEFQEKNTTNVYVSSFLQYLYMHASEICVSYNISVYIYLSYDNPSVGDVCVKLSQSYVMYVLL